MKIKPLLLVATGWIFVSIGVIGIFVPLLPTTIFLIIAAACFARSSEKFHKWLINHKRLGPFIHAWESGSGIPRKSRNRAIALIWVSLSISAVIVQKFWVATILAAVGISLTYYLMSLALQKELSSIE